MSDDDAATTLVDAVEKRLTEIDQSFHSVGTVTAVSDNRATVDIAGGELDLGYPTYYRPVVGDVVQVIGRTGSQFIVARLDFGGLGSDAVFDDIIADVVTLNRMISRMYNGQLNWSATGLLQVTTADGANWGDMAAKGATFNGDVHIEPFNVAAATVFCDDLSTGGLTTNGGAAIIGALQAAGVNCSGIFSTGGATLNGGINTNGATIIVGTVQAAGVNCSGISNSGGAVFGGDLQLNGHNLGVGSIFGLGAAFTGAASASSFACAPGATMNGSGFHGNCGDGFNFLATPPSSKTLKNKPRPVTGALDALPPMYDWEYRRLAEDEKPNPCFDEETHRGPLVEEIADPLLRSECQGFETWNDTHMLATAVAAIGELRQTVETQAAQIAALTARLDALEDLTQSEQ